MPIKPLPPSRLPQPQVSPQTLSRGAANPPEDLFIPLGRPGTFFQKSCSELITLWQNLEQAQQPKWYVPLLDWLSSTTREECHEAVQSKLLHEISDRFLSGRQISDANSHLSQLLDKKIVSHLILEIMGRVHKARCYHNVKAAGVGVYKDFDEEFMRKLLSLDPSKTEAFFEEARRDKIEHKHLFFLPELSKLPASAQNVIGEQALKSGLRLMDPEEIQNLRQINLEYKKLLEDYKIPEQYWPSSATNFKDAQHGFRLLTLHLHPDRVPEEQKAEATEKFKHLTDLAVKLSLKTT